jgi:hypothetical protein
MTSAVFMIDLLRVATFGIACSKRRRKAGIIRVAGQSGPSVAFQVRTDSRAGGSVGLRHPEYTLSPSMLRVYLEAAGVRW